ncbi:MAG TPA: DUF5336 domain-containing protein [Mycobacterium sp.]|nr:DUF5336 domain-containing protein [Mycobacterium sp.]
MTYPPGNPGYPPVHTPGSYGGPAAPQAAPSFAAAGSGVSKLPLIMSVAVLVLGLLAYLASFGPISTIDSYSGTSKFSGVNINTALAVLAGLLAGVGLLPKAKNYAPVVAVLSVLSALWVLSDALTKPDGSSVGWGLWLVLVCVLLQAVAAVGALLLHAGVITPPVPRPSYPQYAPYGQYSPPAVGGYYGGQPSQPGQPDQRTVMHSPYPSQPGGYSSGSQHTQNQGSVTPPTGFPGYGSQSGGASPASSGPDAGSSGAENSGPGAGPTPS